MLNICVAPLMHPGSWFLGFKSISFCFLGAVESHSPIYMNAVERAMHAALVLMCIEALSKQGSENGSSNVSKTERSG